MQTVAVVVAGSACSIDVEGGWPSTSPEPGSGTPPAQSSGPESGDDSFGTSDGDSQGGTTSAGATPASTSSGDHDPITTTGPSLPGTTGSSTGATMDETTADPLGSSTGAAGETGSTDDSCLLDAPTQAFIEAWFFECEPGRIGEVEPVAGVNCQEVCCAFGYDHCSTRAIQDTPFFCVPEVPAPSGGCEEEFDNLTTWQCLCQ